MSGLSVRGLTVLRGGRSVLEDVSCSAPAGALTCVLGLAGAGKTSLLATIAGLLPPAQGAVFRGGRDVTGIAARRRDVALLAPGTALPEARGLRSALRRLAGRGAGAVSDDRMARLGLSDLGDRPAGLLSHGEAALALAAARLGPQGGVLLVDEAGMGLDEPAQWRLLEALRTELSRGRLVLLATRLSAMALAADHLILLSDGHVLQAGTPASLYASPRDAAAARLTGDANILDGVIRELRAGGFVWAAGARHLQATDPGAPRPTLGSPVTLCLRPERIAVLADTDAADNVAEGSIVATRSAGALLNLAVETRLGLLLVAVPSWGAASAHGVGQGVRLGWSAEAATVLA